MTRKEAYQALSDLIYKGFLVSGVNIAGKFFIFKTINDKEFDLMKLSVGKEDSLNSVRFNAFYFAYSVLMIDGKNMLLDREKNISELSDFFLKLPDKIGGKIIEELLSLKTLFVEVYPYIEGFSYTRQSRRDWEILTGLPCNVEFTGVPGTDKLGLNVCQENWIQTNKVLDSEDKYNHDFSMALLIASASNPKGCKSIRSRHDADIDKVKKKREKIVLEGYSRKKREWKPDGWAAPVDTAEQLVAELMRQMEGKKDKHDLFIEDHINKVQQEMADRKREEEQKLEEYRKNHTGPAITGEQRILSAEEAEKLMKNFNNLSIVTDEVANEAEKDKYYNKIGSKIITAKN